MAVPSILVVYPNAGPTGGRRLVQIMGGGFRLPPDPPPLGPVPVAPPTVEVLFGGVAGDRVQVAAVSRLFVRTPPTPLDRQAPEGPVDVTIRNLDDDSEPIPGEEATLVNGYTYELPDLNARPEPDLVRLVRALLHSVKKQVLVNTSLEVHTDWSDAPATGLTFISELPALSLHGPDLRENRFYSTNARRASEETFGLGAKFSEELRPPYTVDLSFELLGVTERKLQGIALQKEVVAFFHRNKTISMLNDASDASKGTATWEMDFEPAGQPVVVKARNNSNVRAFQSRVTIRGFDIDDASMAVLVTRQLEDQVSAGSVVTPSAVDIEPELLES